MEPRVRPDTVTIRPSSLFDAVCVAMESGEFRQCTRRFEQGDARCAWGVIRTVCQRADMDYLTAVHPQFVEIQRRAGAILGHVDIAEANDWGVPLPEIAQALRCARDEIALETS
jgi:hypothetical protein